MASNRSPTAFSPDSEYLAYSSSDGRVTLWDTSTGLLRQEYTPSSHLSATCTCLSWAPTKRGNGLPASPKKKRKRKSHVDVAEEISSLELLAIGTENGNILLYSLVKGDLHSNLKRGHSLAVNDISWLPETDSLFSCSSDKFVVEWSISSCKVKTKWKADDSVVHALNVIDESNLLTASTCIKWWNLSDKTLIKTFAGHATEICKLISVKPNDPDEHFNGYFLSAAVGDRLINAWQMKKESDGNSLASFALTEEPVFVDVSQQQSKEKPILVAAVTGSGVLHIFEHLLNGHRKAPFKPKVTLQITSSSSNSTQSVKQLQILSAQNCNDVNRNLMISYGSFVRPCFERISMNDLQKKTTLVREDCLKKANAAIAGNHVNDKITEPLQPKDAKVIGPAQMAPIRPSANDVEKPLTKDRNHNNVASLPIEERLKELGDKEEKNVGVSEVTEPPKADSLAHLLVQGLQSNDQRMLDSVLGRGDDTLIKNTVSKIPIDFIVPLLSELQKFLYHKGDNNVYYLKWLEKLLQLRLSFLMTLPDLETHLGPLLELLNVRTDVFDRLLRLKGRLNLMMSQVTTRPEEATKEKEPLLMYQEESSSSEESDEDEDEDVMGLMEANQLEMEDEEEKGDGEKSGSEEEMEGEERSSDDEISDENSDVTDNADASDI